jgi:signal transduction histidine kinase
MKGTGDALGRLASLDAAVQERKGAEPDSAVSARELARLLDISRAMHRIHDRDQLLAYVSDRLRELFDAQNGFVVLFDELGRPVIQSSNLEVGGGLSSPVSETLLRRVRESREPLIVDDIALHDDLRDRSSIERLRIASVLCAPLIVEDEVIGVLQFDQRGEPHPFPKSDLRLLSLFADLVATAIYNLQLIERLNRAVDDTRAAQEQLVRAERLSALGEMAAGIAHNFNNTLFVALGLCDVLLTKAHLSEDARAAIMRIRTCALDAANTVRRLQGFTRGRQPDEVGESVLPADVLTDVRDLTRHKWEDEAQVRGLSVDVLVVAGETPSVRARAAELREVLTNLVFNAVDAMEESGTITLTCGSRGGEVFLSVRDEGGGMPEPVQRQLFEPFFTTKGARGHGFGLSTSWTIAHRLGGRIEVESETGRGSEFTVWLPAADDGAVELPSLPDTSARAAQVLIVDDDPVVLDTVCQLVTILGHRPDPRGSGQEALDALSSGEYDAVVSDLGMPGLTGNDLARSSPPRRAWRRCSASR